MRKCAKLREQFSIYSNFIQKVHTVLTQFEYMFLYFYVSQRRKKTYYETISSRTEFKSKVWQVRIDSLLEHICWKISHTFKINVIHNIDELKQKARANTKWLWGVCTKDGKKTLCGETKSGLAVPLTINGIQQAIESIFCDYIFNG